VKVFVVEDSAPVRERIITMLEEITTVELAGEAAGVPEAIDGIARTSPDAVIVDLMLADGNGIDVLQAIARQGFKAKTIVLTNYPTDEFFRKCMETGADYFLDKTIDFDRVKDILEDLAKAFPPSA
jgi:two-component system response regulator DevR